MMGREAYTSLIIGILAAAIATGLRYALDPIIEARAPFITFFAAIFASSFWRGSLAGWVCLAISVVVVDHWYLQPTRYLVPSVPRDAISLTLFVVIGAGTSYFGGYNRRVVTTLKTTLGKLESAIAVSRVGTWEVDVETEQVTASASFNTMFGFPADELPRPLDAYFARLHPDDAERTALATRHAGRTGGRFESEYRVIAADGSERWVLSRGQVVTGPEGTRLVGADFDISDRKAAEAQRDLVSDEVLHRARNIFALVQAVIQNTIGPTPERERLLQRVRALAKGYASSIPGHTEGADLRRILQDELEPFGENRITLDGPDVIVPSHCAMALSLLVHELASNAAKCGCLSVPDGRLAVDWTVTDGVLLAIWSEADGPKAGTPTRTGFGSKLIGNALSGHGGTVERRFNDIGLVARIKLPLHPTGG